MNEYNSLFNENIRGIGIAKTPEIKTIRLRSETYALLTGICRKDQTYDDAVMALLKAHAA